MKEQNNLYMKHSDLIAMTKNNAANNNINNNNNVYLRKDDNGKLTTSQQQQQPIPPNLQHQYSSVEAVMTPSDNFHQKSFYERSPSLPFDSTNDSYKKAPSSADLIETETDNDYSNPSALFGNPNDK